MPVSVEEIDRFARFARELVRREHPASSLEACLRLWREELEIEDTVADVLWGVAAIEAGQFMTLEDADRQIRAELGWPPRVQ